LAHSNSLLLIIIFNQPRGLISLILTRIYTLEKKNL
jgi:hypothetical protein